MSPEGVVEGVFRWIDYEISKGVRKTAHDAVHVGSVAKWAAWYILNHGEEFGVSGEEKEDVAAVAAFTGLMHDLIRNPTESEEVSDGIVTADVLRMLKATQQRKAEKFLLYSNGKVYEVPEGAVDTAADGLLRPKSEDVGRNPVYEERTVASALAAASILKVMGPEALEWFFLPEGAVELSARAIEVNEIKETGKILAVADGFESAGRALQYALTFADKGIEGMGPRVVVRRAQFVSGERVYLPHGDLVKMGLRGKLSKALGRPVSDEELRISAFVLESLWRIFGQKNLSDFPSGEPWDMVRESRAFETAVFYSSALWVMERFSLRSLSDLLELGKRVGYPKLSDEGIYRKVIRSVEHSEFFEGMGREDVVSFILGFAYLEFPETEEIGKRFLSRVKDKTLLRVLKEMPSKEELAVELARYLGLWKGRIEGIPMQRAYAVVLG